MNRDSSKGERPDIKIRLSTFYHILNLAAAGLILAATVWIIVIWGDIPETIPVHFNLQGNPDAWGSKSTLGAMPLVAGLMYLFMSYFGARPRMANYPWEITEDNAEDQYRLTRELIIWLKLETMAIFALIIWSMVRAAAGTAETLSSPAMTVLVAAIVVTIVIFFYRMYRAK
ncbi:MAG: DUF1648 domain-containing protein [Armatimonadota bacterium]